MSDIRDIEKHTDCNADEGRNEEVHALQYNVGKPFFSGK